MDTKKHARKRTKATHQLVNKIKRSEEEREVEKGTVHSTTYIITGVHITTFIHSYITTLFYIITTCT